MHITGDLKGKDKRRMVLLKRKMKRIQRTINRKMKRRTTQRRKKGDKWCDRCSKLPHNTSGCWYKPRCVRNYGFADKEWLEEGWCYCEPWWEAETSPQTPIEPNTTGTSASSTTPEQQIQTTGGTLSGKQLGTAHEMPIQFHFDGNHGKDDYVLIGKVGHYHCAGDD